MTHFHRTLLVVSCLCILGGCGSSSEPAPPPPVKDTAFGDMAGTMDKARGVQDTVDAQKQEIDNQVQSAEGPGEQ